MVWAWVRACMRKRREVAADAAAADTTTAAGSRHRSRHGRAAELPVLVVEPDDSLELAVKDKKKDGSTRSVRARAEELPPLERPPPPAAPPQAPPRSWSLRRIRVAHATWGAGGDDDTPAGSSPSSSVASQPAGAAAAGAWGYS